MKKEKLDINMNISRSAINESTMSGDIATWTELIEPVIFRLYTESLVSEIADIQPLKSPIGKVYALYAYYSNRDTDDVSSNNSSILLLSDTTWCTVDGTIATANGSGTILYIEDKYILVKVDSGYFAINDNVTGHAGVTVDDVISNRTYAKKVFKEYAAKMTTSQGESNSSIRNLDYELIANTIEVMTRKLKSKFTVESIQDLQAMYGVDVAKDIIIQEFSSEMIQQIDMEIIDYLKTIATPQSDVVLANSYATNNDMSAIGNDIYLNIYYAAMQIMRDTKRKQHFFVIADSVTMSFLLTNPFKIAPEVSPKNSYYTGKLGGLYNLYLDPYSSEHYCIVGYRSMIEETGDAGLIFAPYINSINTATDPDTGNEVFFNTVRFGYTRHPQDTGTGTADSIFFRTFAVNTANIVNFPQGN